MAAHELGFWKLVACEVLSVDTNNVIERAPAELPGEVISHEVSTAKIEEIKAKCLNQRVHFAESLKSNSTIIGELFNRNVNEGTVTVSQMKK